MLGRCAFDFFAFVESRDRCYDFKNSFASKFGEKNLRFILNTVGFLQNFDHNIDFYKKRQFFLPNIGENR
jgi:hypothetical protein